MEITPKVLKKLTQKKFRREFALCILEGEKIIADNEGRIIKLFAQSEIPADVLRDVKSLDTYAGPIAVAEIPRPDTPTAPFLVLDNIQDAGNMGAILRSCAAFGYRTIYAVACVDPWSQKVLRASSGLAMNLNIIECDYSGLPNAKMYIADAGGENVSGVRPADKNFGIILGNEGRGVSPALYNRPGTAAVSVPMAPNCESLNVAVAGGILMYLLSAK